MAAAIPDPSTLEVANSASPTTVAPTAPEPDDLHAFLNSEPDEYDTPPKRETPPVETPRERPVVEAPVVVRHHPRLVEAAQQVGLEDHIIAKLSPDDLMDAVFNLERKWRHLDTNDTRRHQEQRPVTPKTPEPVVDEDEEALQALEAEGYPAPLLKLLRSAKQKTAAVETTVKQSTQSDMQRRHGEMLDVVEDTIASLGPKFERVVGKGSITEVDADAKDVRNIILSQAGVSPMDSPRAIARKITLTAQKLYGKLLADPAPNAVAEEYGKKPKSNGKTYTEEEWDRAGLAKPTATNVPKPRGARAAAQAVAARMQDFGVSRGQDDEEFDGLPN